MKRNREALAVFSNDADLQQTVDKWITGKKYSKLLDLWVKGLEMDWSKLYSESKPPRISLPAYPFARERYWVDTTAAAGPTISKGAATAVLHPLVHSNTSDLSAQRYSSTFTGEEFFLADHQVKVNGSKDQKVLPGVAYLEMARVAIEQASAVRPESTVLELQNIVWAQPVVVTESKQISIALLANEADQIDYEIYSQDADQDIVHCQGSAIWGRLQSSSKVDLEQLNRQMDQGQLEPSSVYATCAQMGLVYGPALQGIAAIHRGTNQVLARLQMPKTVESTLRDYVLHPSLMDSALQAAVGLIDDTSELFNQPRLPFALDSLRIMSSCTREMFAWVRYAPGSQAEDKIIRLDIDLCDQDGNICVQMRGLSSRILNQENTEAIAQEPAGTLYAVPSWKSCAVASSAGARELEYIEHHVILCELPQISIESLQSLVPQSQCLLLHAPDEKNVAQRYSECALTCFERIQTILQSKPQDNVLVQIVVAGHQEQALFAGLSGLLKTATLEKPQFIGQLILVTPETTTEELATRLQEEKSGASMSSALMQDTLIRYAQGARQVLRWQEPTADLEKPPIAFKDQGIYLITGGLGGLGLLFAGEILGLFGQTQVVLTGRGALTPEKQARFDELSAHAYRASYRHVDLCDLDQVKQLIADIQAEYGQLNGILHCAGTIADNFLVKKTSAEFNKVLAPKVIATYNLDQASQDVQLDFFVLFSSIAALGNVGQADYATANCFMDQFAAYRNKQVAAQQRHGHTRSINWPLWRAGGMGIDAASQELLKQSTGMLPMQTTTGMEAFHRSLALSHDQMLVVEGDLVQMRRTLFSGSTKPSRPQAKPVIAAPDVNAAGINKESLAEKMQDYLRKQFSGLLKLPAHKIDAQAPLEKYGIDSILAMRLTNELEKTFGSLSKTLFFEYQTIAALAGYFVKAHPAIVCETVGLSHEEPKAKDVDQSTIEKRPPTPVKRNKSRFVSPKTNDLKDIAIVGLSGRYPQAENLQEFWTNLKNGRDCITEIPSERWDYKLYYDPSHRLGKSYSRWGGFISDVDKFDPLFFNVSPKEAELTDPQERLFLQTAWETIEDAGYTKESISGSRVGVYVGVMWGQYELFGAESILRGNASIPTSSHASIANRVSYFFDLHGPSIALDTMCSSSLTAIHLACEELRNGEIDAAIAGGVNLTIHPYKYLSLSMGNFVASDGKCRSFGEGGDGYVPGEGVGAILLKPLQHALRDGDQIYAVIKSSTLNHGGKTNGYTVPNPNAQADLILDALKKAKIDPKTLGYIETHGTGTSLGDPIEITGLLKAYEGSTEEKQFCPIGSVKSNIGHLESAAGIAAVTKALLQIRHKQLVPSLHANPLNPNINFKDSPFYVQTELTEWKHLARHPRRVGVSSFGAGGSNAHLILEEYADATELPLAPQTASPEAFVLSARNQDALCRYAERIVNFLDNGSDVSLADLAYTSQIGRTPMDARLVTIASSLQDLKDKLNQWITLQKNQDVNPEDNAPELEDVFYGNIREAQYSARNLMEGQAGKAFLENLLAHNDLEKISRLWVLGVEIDWSHMRRPASPRKISLPTYPFAKERYWVNQEIPSLPFVQNLAFGSGNAAAQKPVEEKRRTHYRPQWTLKPIAVIENDQPNSPILILDTSDELFLTMKAQLEGRSKERLIILVKPGNSFQEIEPDVYLIEPEREEQFHELIESLKNRAQLPSVVLHHCSEVCNLGVKSQVSEQLNHGVYTLFHLCKALMKDKLQTPLKVMSVFSSPSGAAAPLQVAMSGFFKTLTLENPKYFAKVVDIQGGDTSVFEKAGLIWNEINGRDWTASEIRYSSHGEVTRSRARCMREFTLYTPEKELPAMPLRQRGVYLITGGLGGLGLVFNEYLAKKFQAKLVLIGRSFPNGAQEEELNQLKASGSEVMFVRADVSKLEDMEMVVREAKARFTEINGVIHAAGVNRDAFILKKRKQEMEAVLASKVYGAINIDLATSNENLDLFVMFSSVAGVLGNIGQCDYAYANRFLDSFAESRESLRQAQKRSGRSLSINWPLWADGGMSISLDDIARLEKQTGICPLPTEEGICYWEEFLQSEAVQGVALYGIASKIAAYIDHKTVKAESNASAISSRVDSATLFAKTEAYLKALIGEEIKLAPDRIGSSDRLESFGIDSVMINHLNANLERDLGALPKTLLYEHETVRELAKFLLQESREALVSLLGFNASAGEPVISPMVIEPEPIQQHEPKTEPKNTPEPIAIIGIHGYYPHSANLYEYWENLKHGKDLVDLVPHDRWNYEEFYDADPAAASDGKIYCKWGGFLEDYDKFDPHFFNISAGEAKITDPQERLFLQSVWAAIEDAGYTRDSLKKRFAKARSADVGVFAGVTTNSYHLWAPEERFRGNIVCPSAMPWSIANRVSYFFDFNGPSMAVDTACSSSLVALHLACESLKNRECQVAIAGGVNLYLHPSKYQSLCQRRMLSLDGKCHSFGAGDDGFVPGEGVGTLVLKRLSKAIEHQDRIYAVIPASAFDHSGRSNGYSAPNPNSQANLISNTLSKANIHPETIGYVEGHGTGTQLGDSIEIAALTQAFQKYTTKKQFCPIGSVRANIGHSESAAGIASVAKVVMQMKHGQLAPSIHSDKVNPDIEFKESPFYLQHGLSEWQPSPAHPRRALINSFGAGGVNACVVLEEYMKPRASNCELITGPYLFTLSAKNEDRLREHADQMIVRLRSEPDIDLADLCYTLQTGREAMEERLTVVVSETNELIDRLNDWSQHGSSTHVHQGSPGAHRGSKRSRKIAKKAIENPGLIELASKWVAGEEIDWEGLYPESKPHRIALPTYPFARERYWVTDSPASQKPTASNALIHPLISYNSSTLKEISFSSSLPETAFYAVDHKVNEQKIFPGAGFLEMACISGNIAGEQRVRKIKDIVWVQPLNFHKGPQTLRTVLKDAGDSVEYVISSLDEENEPVLHSEGRLTFRNGWANPEAAEDCIPIEALKAQCGTREDGAAYYRKFRKYGFNYGPSFQTIQEIYVNHTFALSKLKIADHLKGDFSQFILHPSMMDGALQTVAGLAGGLESTTPHLPFALDEVEILHPVRQTCYAYAEFADSHEQNHTGVRKFNIRLLNESGDVLINFKNLFVRPFARPEAVLTLAVAAGA
ncbi:MAG TPA: SDR family NAD(P)-dependent oxidoreductase [Candidatus Angelobacter sp.]|nr:SDR family NAD(P)-dependent oxidoreductase [Candidatus Angelobacter sp.]